MHLYYFFIAINKNMSDEKEHVMCEFWLKGLAFSIKHFAIFFFNSSECEWMTNIDYDVNRNEWQWMQVVLWSSVGICSGGTTSRLGGHGPQFFLKYFIFHCKIIIFISSP